MVVFMARCRCRRSLRSSSLPKTRAMLPTRAPVVTMANLSPRTLLSVNRASLAQIPIQCRRPPPTSILLKLCRSRVGKIDYNSLCVLFVLFYCGIRGWAPNLGKSAAAYISTSPPSELMILL